MVKHSQALQENHVPEWITAYIDYANLKVQLSKAAKELESVVLKVGAARQTRFDRIQLGLAHSTTRMTIAIEELREWQGFASSLVHEICTASDFYRQQVRTVTEEFLHLVRVCIELELINHYHISVADANLDPGTSCALASTLTHHLKSPLLPPQPYH